MKRMTRRVIAILLAVVTLCAVGGVYAYADDSDYIYYSDLFYGYDSSYLKSPYLRSYLNDTYQVMTGVRYAYENSPSFTWTSIKTSINASLSLKGYLELISDGYGDTNYTYTNALDKANEKFVETMFDGSALANATSDYGTAEKITGRAKSLISLYNQFNKNFDIYELTDEEIITQYASMLTSSGTYVEITSTQITQVYTEKLLPELDTLGDILDYGKTAYEAAGALSLALMIEDIRLELIDSVIEHAPTDSTLYEGMTRLRSQLRNGWQSYFADNYIKDTVLSELCSVVQKEITGRLSAYGLVSAILKVASWVVFDLVFDVPDLEDIVTQQVLTEYATDMYDALLSEMAAFDLQFSTEDIFFYEETFSAYTMLTELALNATRDLEIDSTEGAVDTVLASYADFSYENYISTVKATILETPQADRLIKDRAEWTMELPVTVQNASDTILMGDIYCFDGAVYGDLLLFGSGSIIGENEPVIIDGDIGYYGHNKTLNISDSIIVNGDMTVCSSLKFDHGHLEVKGNLTLISGHYCGISMTHEDDYLLVHGDYTVTTDSNINTYNCTLTAGTIEIKGNFTESGGSSTEEYYYETETHKTVFSGTETQTISFEHPYSYTYGKSYNLFANLYLENTDINFATPIYQFTLNQDTTLNNTEQLTVLRTLDLNGYTFNKNGDLEVHTLCTNNGTLHVTGNLTSGLYSTKTEFELTGGDVIVDGNMDIYTTLKFDKCRLEVGGNLTLISGHDSGISMTNEDDYLLVHGDYTVTTNSNINTYNCTLTAGTVEIKGNFTESGGSSTEEYYYETETHKTVFSGTETQTISFAHPNGPYGTCNLFANLYLENTDINFATPIYQLTLNQDMDLYDTELLRVKNLLDLNGYTLTVYDDVSYGALEENGGKLIIVCTHKSLSSVVAAEPDCVTDGNIAHWACTKCGACFADENGTQPLTAEEVTIPALGHSYGAWYVVTAATAEHDGEERRDCANCNSFETRAIFMHTHSYDDGVVTKEPTCTEAGEESFTCGSCGDRYTETIAATGHTVVTDTAVEPTCTAAGLTEGSHCSECHEVFVAQTEIAATGHSWDEGVVTTEPMETEAGEKTFTCTVCGETRTEEYGIPTQAGPDINMDGEVNSLDLIVLMKHIISKDDSSVESGGDLNEDGSVDILDVIRLVRYLCGDFAETETTATELLSEPVEEVEPAEEEPMEVAVTPDPEATPTSEETTEIDAVLVILEQVSESIQVPEESPVVGSTPNPEVIEALETVSGTEEPLE